MELSREELENYAKEFVQKLPTRTEQTAYIVGLKGNLGSGKTTFTQEVAKALGIKEQVTSPTFVIAQRYETTHPTFKQLVHMDAYRLAEEVGDTIGFDTYVKDPENIVFVEWPENLPKGIEFPNTAPVLEFETVDETTRRITQHG